MASGALKICVSEDKPGKDDWFLKLSRKLAWFVVLTDTRLRAFQKSFYVAPTYLLDLQPFRTLQKNGSRVYIYRCERSTA